jgi:hypothetical protein
MGAFERTQTQEVQIFFGARLGARGLRIDGRFIFFKYTPNLGQRGAVCYPRYQFG